MVKRLLILVSALFIAFYANIVQAGESSGEDDFDVNELIMHHIKDAHEWHILDYKKENGESVVVAVPLPVILFYDGRLYAFMSSEFKHGTAVVERDGTYFRNFHEHIYVVDKDGELHTEGEGEDEVITNAKPLDFSITKNVLALFVAALLAFWVFVSVARAYKRHPGRPKGFQALMEPVILFVRNDIIYPNLGEKTDKFAPYLLSLFFFILFNNLLGIVPFFPGNANATGNIAVTMTLAIFTFLAINLNGNKHYWQHTFWMPGVPVFVRPILAVVECMGMIVKPVALTIRLFANITAGHIIILSLVSLIFIMGIALSPVSVLFVLFMNCLELLVAFLQAYIFTILSSLFISLAVSEHH